MRFSPIMLPTTYKRTNLIAHLRRRVNPFANLLALVAPRKYAQVANANGKGWDYYLALLNWCGPRFPVWCPEYLVEEFDNETDLMDGLMSLGIPVSPVGEDEDAMLDGFSATLCSVAYLLEAPTRRTPVPTLIERHIGNAWTGVQFLKPWWDAQIDVTMFYPSRGRTWVGHWKSLPWLLKYVYHDTGYQWLDYSELDCDEGGNPPWTKVDIDFLISDWAEAKQVWTPLKKFIRWLDAEPEGRLPTLMAVLTGDDVVRREISRPVRSKTLAEVFDVEDKKAQQARARARARA